MGTHASRWTPIARFCCCFLSRDLAGEPQASAPFYGNANAIQRFVEDLESYQAFDISTAVPQVRAEH